MWCKFEKVPGGWVCKECKFAYLKETTHPLKRRCGTVVAVPKRNSDYSYSSTDEEFIADFVCPNCTKKFYDAINKVCSGFTGNECRNNVEIIRLMRNGNCPIHRW